MTEPIHPEVLRHWTAILEALEKIGIGVVVVADRGGVLERLYASRCALSLLGLSSIHDDAPVMASAAAEERARLDDMRARKLAGLETPPTYETVVRQPDGRCIPVELNDINVPIDGGYLTISFLRDISRRQETQGAQLEAERMAIVGAIAAGVAHEINNPLTYVLLHLRSLRRSLPRWNLETAQSEDADRLLAEAEGGAERVRVIVRDLLALARGHGPIDDGIDVVTVVDSAVRLIAPSMNHRARVVREGDRVPPVAGDESRLAHATLAMLLFAAAAFERDDPAINSIMVRVNSSGTSVVIEVADNGRDLSSDEMARVFEPFYTPRGGGAGASLAVARTVAAGLGGSVELHRRDGGGTVTRMSLPSSSRTRR